LKKRSAPPAYVSSSRAPIRGLFTGDDVKAFMAAQEKNNDNNIYESGVSVVSVVAVSSQRILQDIPDQSDFGLQASLQGIDGDSGKAQEENKDIVDHEVAALLRVKPPCTRLPLASMSATAGEGSANRVETSSQSIQKYRTYKAKSISNNS
jgi:hypothetical protein